MTKLHATSKAKGFRGALDEILQEMKAHKAQLFAEGFDEDQSSSPQKSDSGEVIAQHTISIRAVEDAMMRQGMVLKNIGATPDPYPQTKLTLGSVAAELYARYCRKVGGKAFNGDPLPDWDTFYADPAKQTQVQGWLDAADFAMSLGKIHPTADGLKM